MTHDAEIRIAELQRIRDAFEPERDKLLDQVQYLKGQADRIEWVIKVLNGQIAQIEKEEEMKAAIAEQREESLKVAREKGNVGSHPSEKKETLEHRRKTAKKSKKKSTKSE